MSREQIHPHSTDVDQNDIEQIHPHSTDVDQNDIEQIHPHSTDVDQNDISVFFNSLEVVDHCSKTTSGG